VSYGNTWQAPTDTTMGLVPLGYADGIPRSAGNKADVVVGERRCPIIGRVAMDQFVVDLGPDAKECPGDPVRLFGGFPDGASQIPTADDWARRLDTIGYEIVTRIGGRVPRQFTPRTQPAGQ